MKYIPKKLEHELNTTKDNPILDILIIGLSVLSFLVLIYLISGFVFDKVIDQLTIEQENKISTYFSENKISNDKKYNFIIPIFDKLHKASSLENRNIQMLIKQSETKNAFASPNGVIIILSSLIESSNSINELAMIIGHELGHFAHKDHLRSSSRSIFLALVVSIIFGTDTHISQIIQDFSTSIKTQYSQERETLADNYGINLVNKVYGHVNGTLDFFLKKSYELSSMENINYYFSTHPHPMERVKSMKSYIIKQGFKEKGKLSKLPLGQKDKIRNTKR